ncbi:MAG: ribosomal protein S18-alanine N-acetyltransferase [Proteobacteria bacterium]|nr:ribosomal protein S18-alanine N-acetyltransferase [Pseudomonadota bacterium]
MTDSELTFRQMALEDISAVIQLENEVYQFPWTDRIFKDCIRVGYDCWLAHLGNTIVAHAVISIAAGESHILNLSVTRNHQGKGIGKQFIQFLLNIARNKRAQIMMLEVRPSNIRAINCYSSAGFNEIGCRKDYYPAPNGKEDALLFAKQIP